MENYTEEEKNIVDQDAEDIKNDENSDEQSAEGTEEPITLERAVELAQKAQEIAHGTQKGYTLTRQELAEIRANQEAIQNALEELKSQKFGDYDDYGDEEPITAAKLEDIIAKSLTKYEQQKIAQQTDEEAMIDNMIADMKAEGLITNDKEADDLIAFTIESAKAAGLKQIPQNYIFSVYPAWQKAKEAEALKEQIKTKIRGEVGSKVGTSEKTSSREQGVSYKEIRHKDWDEF